MGMEETRHPLRIADPWKRSRDHHTVVACQERIGRPRAGAAASQKGGAGKTTLATHLAVALGRNRRVVLVDTDPQRSAAAWWRVRDVEQPELVEATPRGSLPPRYAPSARPTPTW